MPSGDTRMDKGKTGPQTPFDFAIITELQQKSQRQEWMLANRSSLISLEQSGTELPLTQSSFFALFSVQMVCLFAIWWIITDWANEEE